MMKSNYDYEVKEFFDTLASTPSILKKKELIAEKTNDWNVKKFLDYLLNPYFVTGISEKKINRPIDLELAKNTNTFDSFHELMAYIRENHTGSEEVLVNIHIFLRNVMFDENTCGRRNGKKASSELCRFYIGIITKSIRLGCDAKTVNDALGYELIPIWEVQQAYQINKVKLNENEWFSLSQKLNGVRGTFFEGKIISRQGKEFTGLDHIITDILDLYPGNADDYVIDGELIRKNIDGVSDNENFRLTSGIINQEVSDKSSIQFVIFDILPKVEFLQGSSKQTYKKRMKELKEADYYINMFGMHNLKVVDILYSGTDAKMIDICLDKMVAEGKEGLMLNRDCKYFRKRHNGILKVKRFYTVDLRVIDVEEGTGRLKGSLGAFVVRYKDNILHVGTGMTDDQRKIFWNEREGLIDRIIEVKYKEESRDKETGKPSLQFPVFVQLRELGKQESYD